MWPVLQRELREQARQRAGHWLRVLGAGVVLAVLAFVWDDRLFARQGDGRGLFAGLNHVLITAIWLLAPVLTADCLSREKREGTLGLLFLTPLTARDIVVGKAFVHALRAFTLVLAAAPVLMVPVLLGGIGWMDALRMLLLHLAALALALTAGLVASSVTTRWVRARLLSFLMVAVAGAAFLLLYISLTALVVWLGSAKGLKEFSYGHAWSGQLLGWQMRLGLFGTVHSTFWKPVGGAGAWWGSVTQAGAMLAGSLGLVWLAVRFATAGVRRTWQGEPPSPRAQRAASWLTRVRAPAEWWRQRAARLLDRNPVLWRQTSTWSSRVTLSGWLVVTMVLVSQAIVNDGWADASAGQWLGRRLLLVGLAFAAAGSFREEKEHGGLELLLVTPLSPKELVSARLQGLFRQFAPAAAMLIGVQAVLALFFQHRNLVFGNQAPAAAWLLEGAEFGAWMAATAALGVALATGRLAFLVAFLATAAAHHAAGMFGDFLAPLLRGTNPQPPIIPLGLGLLPPPPEWQGTPLVVSLIVAGGVFLFARDLAERRLAERRFLHR